MDIFLKQLIQFYSNKGTNLHHLTQNAELPHNIETVMQPQITVTPLHPMHCIYQGSRFLQRAQCSHCKRCI